MLEASDHIATLLRDPTFSHSRPSHCVVVTPESVFSNLWTTYFEQSQEARVANFVIAKVLERTTRNADQLSYATNELRDSLSKLRRMYVSHILY